MIYYLNSCISRGYLNQWFLDDMLVITDGDINTIKETNELLISHPIKNRIVDITHNPVQENTVTLDVTPVLTNNFEYWYHPDPTRIFFPLFLWMYSMRNSLWWAPFSFDAGSKKTKGIMCLNRQPRDHRTWLWDEFNRKNLIDQMMYTFVGHCTLPNESPDPNRNDVGIDHLVYSEYAVNIVTETSIDLTYISEKTCKPFIARQIPIIVGSVGSNKFLQDVGLDMFEDIVPWHNWDSESDSSKKLQNIADFVEQWINSGTILTDYQRVLIRIERNKQYFHSEKFRERIMNQMIKL